MFDKKLCLVLSLAITLVGCASTGVVQTDGDKYMIAKKSPQVGFGPPIGVRAEVYQEANEFCGKQNKSVETVNLELTNSGFGRAAAVNLEFRCKNKE
jgi:outer membrane lipoprotein SlyB